MRCSGIPVSYRVGAQRVRDGSLRPDFHGRDASLNGLTRPMRREETSAHSSGPREEIVRNGEGNVMRARSSRRLIEYLQGQTFLRGRASLITAKYAFIRRAALQREAGRGSR
jgi:hypothetical protein